MIDEGEAAGVGTGRGSAAGSPGPGPEGVCLTRNVPVPPETLAGSSSTQMKGGTMDLLSVFITQIPSRNLSAP